MRGVSGASHFSKEPKMRETTIKSYAKINLSLDVTGIREDGYHELETVMQRVSLVDEVRVRWSEEAEGINLGCSKPYLPVDERNIAYKAAALMVREFGEKVPKGGVEIFIEKHIPVAAGLAGGSGNGAAVMIALNRIWNLGLSTRKLCALSAELGADVPFCVLIQNTGYGCALCRGTGTELYPLRNRLKKAVLLVKPPFGVSTKEVYKGIDNCDITKRPDTQKIVTALKKGRQDILYESMANVLEEYTLSRYSEAEELKEKIARETAAEKVMMTGSGPTIFALFGDLTGARKACDQMRRAGHTAYWAKMI